MSIKRTAYLNRIRLSAVRTDGTFLFEDKSVASTVIMETASASIGSKVDTDEVSLAVQIFLPRQTAEQLIEGLKEGEAQLNIEAVPTLLELSK